jgi:hypothetical protein
MTERKSGSRKPRSPEKQPAASDQPSFGIEQPEKRPSVALVVAVMLTAILEVLDITIVSVAIPHMLGSFGATSDQSHLGTHLLSRLGSRGDAAHRLSLEEARTQ